MITKKVYKYELRDGWGRLAGYYRTEMKLVGNNIQVPLFTIFIGPYSEKRTKFITLPIVYRNIYDDGVEYLMRRSLSVKGIKKKYIEIIASSYVHT